VTTIDFLARQRIDANDAGSPAVFADAVYNAWRDDALASISRASPMPTSASLSVTSGTRTYPVPADWITSTSSIVEPSTVVDYSPFYNAPVYRIEDAAGGFLYLDTHFTIFGRTITLVSAPTASGTWTIRYGGTWTIPLLPAEWIKIALDYSSARSFEQRATVAASYFDYSLGGGSVSITKSGESKRWLSLAEERMECFEESLKEIATNASSFGTFSFQRG
jgi:hypothetical protein